MIPTDQFARIVIWIVTKSYSRDFLVPMAIYPEISSTSIPQFPVKFCDF